MMDIQGINIVKRGQKSKRWCRLEKTKYASNDTEVLKNRLLVTDEELRLNYNLRFWFAKLNSWESIWDKYKCYQLRF